MADVLEELSVDTLTRSQVEERVEDWVRRIDDLYGRIESWLPPKWYSQQTRCVWMLEEPMREVGLPPRELPVLDLLTSGASAAVVEPRGLWIVGTNGRLDLRRGASHHLILDKAANFEAPDWGLMPMSDRRRVIPFDRSSLLSVLA